MTMLDGLVIAEQWLYIFKKKLSKDLTPTTWLKSANVWLDKCAAIWKDKILEIKWIFYTISNAITKNKITYIQFFYPKFLDN